MKTCSKCGRLLSDDNFYKDKKTSSGLSCWCKECVRKDSKMRYDPTKRNKSVQKKANKKARIKKMAYVDTLKTPCAKCGCATPYVLNFHHINHMDKSFDLGKAYSKSYDRISEEASKCICLCYNCHHTYHYFYGMQPTNPVESLNEFLDPSWQPPTE